MSCALRLPRNNWITIIFCSFLKHLLYIYKSSAMACIFQGCLQQSKLKAKCSYAILLSLCSAVNGSLQHKTAPYCPYGHSQNATIHLQKKQSDPAPYSIQRPFSTHTRHAFTLWGEIVVLLLFPSISDSSQHQLLQKKRCGQLWSNLSRAECAF